MRGYLSLWLVVLVAAAAVMPHAASAQTPGDTGTIVVQLFRDINNDGKISSAEETMLLPGCRVVILADLTHATIPFGTKVGSDQLPAIASSLPTNGVASFDLPVGRYSVATPNCFTADLGDLEPGVVYYTPPKCCPNTDGSPEIQIVTDVDGKGSLEIQTVDLRAGQTTNVTVRGYPKHETTRRQYVWYLGALAAFAVVAILVVSIWRFRPRYDPTSDPDNPKEYAPVMPEERPADFDDVFGEFLKKKDNG